MCVCVCVCVDVRVRVCVWLEQANGCLGSRDMNETDKQIDR